MLNAYSRLPALVLFGTLVCYAQVTFTEYPGTTDRPAWITAGPDGNIWFTEESLIGRITQSGLITQFPIPAKPCTSLSCIGGRTENGPSGITAGADGNVWFTEQIAGQIGRITPAGVISEFSLPTNTAPQGITAGPDGNLWFTARMAGNAPPNDYIGRITPAGVITQFPVPGSDPRGITAGPDGNLWFTEFYTDKIGRITPAGVITEFSVLAPFRSGLLGITAGPDGNLWFIESFANKIGRITPAGVVTEFPIPSLLSGPPAPSSGPQGITAARDGNLWFTEHYTNKIGRITPAGVINEFPIPTANSLPSGITAGPDGNLWFAEFGAYQIGEIHLPFSLCLLYDPTKAAKSGSTIPIKLQLCDSSGNDLSSSNITLHAVSVTQISNSISGQVQDSGNANPDNDFRFDSTLGSTGGYIFNLSTTGLSTGSYNLNFTVTGDSFVYAAPFQVK